MKTNLKSKISFLLLALSIFAIVPAWADGIHYLAFATDRHQNLSQVDSNTPVVSTAMSCWSNLPVEYVSLIGDMVGERKSDAPAYDVKTVWDEVNDVFPNLTSDKFSIVWADHDGGYTDPSELGVMKCPSASASDYGNKSAHIYTAPDGSYYIYAINYYEMLNYGNDAPEAFMRWVDGIDKTALVIVLCHAPMHYKRKDNLNGSTWSDALNYAATGSVGGTEVKRNVVFFHGHNHTSEATEYYYAPGSTVAMQGSDSQSVNTVIYYTYITAGYMKVPTGATSKTINATLVTLTDKEVTFTKSKSGATTLLGTVERVARDERMQPGMLFETGYVELTLGENNNTFWQQIQLVCNGQIIEGKTIRYTSSNEEVATVAEDGTVTVHKVGTANIIATFDGDEDYNVVEGYYEIVVTQPVCATPVLTYTGGKVTCTCETEGVKYAYTYSLMEGSGESTDGEIIVSPVLVRIDVKATREGYTDSEAASIEIDLMQQARLQGDINNDGALTIADVTTLVNMILGK